MEDIQTRAKALQAEIDKAANMVHLSALLQEKSALDEQISAPGLWDNPATAQEATKKQAKLTKRVTPWVQLQSSLRDIMELSGLNDDSLEKDLAKQLDVSQAKFDELKADLKFRGPYDDHDAIVSLYAGAGGTDAQDWTQILLRMYIRWAEKNGFEIKTVDESPGEEAGLKSVTIEISGPLAYGKLKSEHGVHRLVRLSPFNSAASRETSFAKVDVLPKVDKPDELELDDKELRIDVYRSGGHGGQSVNTTDSAVRVTHLPTGITVAIQNERSQLQNKETALTILRSRLAQLQLEQHQEKLGELKGPNQSAEWGNQIRSYVLHPYKQVKDLRTKHESSDPDSVLDGDLDGFINAYLEQNVSA